MNYATVILGENYVYINTKKKLSTPGQLAAVVLCDYYTIGETYQNLVKVINVVRSRTTISSDPDIFIFSFRDLVACAQFEILINILAYCTDMYIS